MKIGHAAAALVAASGLQLASADVLVFENDNPSFRLQAQFDEAPHQSLVVHQDAWSQPTPDFSVPSTGFSFHSSEGGSESTFTWGLRSGASAAIKTADPVSYPSPNFPGGEDFVGPRLFTTGAVVDGSQAAADSAIFWLMNFVGPTPPGAYLVPDPTFIVGVEFELSGQTHYGFIEFEHQEPGTVNNATWQPVRWGYESEPGVALVIPGEETCPADLAEPFGTVDIFDLLAFVSAYENQEAAADLAEPFGVYDVFDVLAYVDAYDAGCP